MKLVAHPLLSDYPDIVPAPRRRDWSQATADPNRCLPFSIACQSGWWVLNPATFTCIRRTEGIVQVSYEPGATLKGVAARYHFRGGGMVTIDLPFLFRTEPGWDLQVRAPANLPLPGAYCLEAIVETDWAVVNVAVSWVLTDEERSITFAEGFPLCQLVPVKRSYLEAVEPAVEPSQEALEEYAAYYTSRVEDFTAPIPSTKLEGYFAGLRADGSRFEGQHVQRLDLKPWRLREPGVVE